MLFWEVSRMEGIDEDQRASLVSFCGLLLNKAVILTKYRQRGVSATAIAFLRRVSIDLIGRVGKEGCLL
jgi:hypothetical protein